jgi:hypothetical protein
VNTDTITGRVIVVDYGKPLADMIAAGKYDWVSPNITAGRFPVKGTGTKRFRAKLFNFGRFISSEGALAAIEHEGFTPGSHVHGLAFGAAFPEEQRKYPIACLGSSAQVLDGRVVVYLGMVGDKRGLHLTNWNDGWNDQWRVLGVQEVSEA